MKYPLLRHIKDEIYIIFDNHCDLHRKAKTITMSIRVVVFLFALLTATVTPAPIYGPAQTVLSCSIIKDFDGYLLRVTSNGTIKADAGEENAETRFSLHFNGKTIQVESGSGLFLMLHSVNASSNSTGGCASGNEIVMGAPSPSAAISTIWTPNSTEGDLSGKVSLSQKTDNGDCFVEFGQDGAKCVDALGENTLISFSC